MEVIKRKILLENSIDRNIDSQTWGSLTASSFSINIQLTQTIDDMGLFTDIEFIPKTDIELQPDYSLLINKLNENGFTFPFMSGVVPIYFNNLFTETDEVVLRIPQKTVSQYYFYENNPLSGFTDSKLDDVRSYNNTTPYILGFNVNKETYVNYVGDLIDGVNKITSIGEPKIYVFDAIDDSTIGTINQITGLQYKDFSGATINQQGVDIPITTFRFITEGWNETNTSLSALTKEEFLMGIISRPEVENDVFIDRGVIPVLDYHLRLSEIRNLGQLQQYGNGYYKIDRT